MVGPPAPDLERTRTGLLLLLIGAALSWIPYLDLVGGLLVLIGIVYVFLGRRGFGPAHRRSVVAGSVLILIGLLGVVVVTVAFVADTVSSLPPGSTPAQAASVLQNELLGLLVTEAVFGFLAGLGELLLVYQLADRIRRGVLWVAFALRVAIGAGILLVEYPLLSRAIQQATSGSSIDLGPINSLMVTIDLWSTLDIVPALLLVYVYYRIREDLPRTVIRSSWAAISG